MDVLEHFEFLMGRKVLECVAKIPGSELNCHYEGFSDRE